MAKPQKQRAGKKAGKAGRVRRATRRRRTRTVKPNALNLSAPVTESKLHTMKIGDFYRPLKKPITVRIDADVLAWFKKDGRRYQSRINAALRKTMEREMKAR
jgi:uncharacterized protein (DUF4415 family)